MRAFNGFVSAAAVLSMSIGVGMQPAQAGAPMVKTQAPGFYRLMVGDFEVTALLDGTAMLPIRDFMNDITPAQVDRALAREFLKNPVEVSINTFLINTGSKLLLVDTGDAAGMDGTGHLQENLKAAGYDVSQVDEIYITHMHGDHISGLTVKGERAFPNAVVRASRQDADYWLSAEKLAAAQGDAKESFQSAQRVFEPYIKAGKFSPFDGDIELVPGVHAVATHGHTPGHTCYLIESRGERMLFVGDLLHVASVQFANPAITMKFDTDSAAARAQRLRIFREAAANHEWIAAAHIAFPGIGHVRAKRQGYDFVPAHYGIPR
jgi:glyoxylase-like metal-dependent hydrolase (beta-lactamase superfamily II)